jgi:hypothetical protein
LLERAGDFENAFNAFETGARLKQVLNTIDLESIVRYQRLYSDLMNHWQASLPDDRILEVRYEDLVSRPGEIIPEIVSHAGLKLEPGCLSPHRARTPVMTASMAQVRQPIHTGAVSGWKRYEPWLAERHEVFRITEGTIASR